MRVLIDTNIVLDYNLPVSREYLQRTGNGFGPRERETEKQKSKVSGTVPPFSGAPDDL